LNLTIVIGRRSSCLTAAVPPVEALGQLEPIRILSPSNWPRTSSLGARLRPGSFVCQWLRLARTSHLNRIDWCIAPVHNYRGAIVVSSNAPAAGLLKQRGGPRLSATSLVAQSGQQPPASRQSSSRLRARRSPVIPNPSLASAALRVRFGKPVSANRCSAL
jgi:hypothetical protein